MAAKEKFWTDEKLKELARIFPKKNIAQLEKYYKKQRDDIIQAYNFYIMDKKLRISRKKIKNMTITHYKPAFPEGYHDMPSYDDLPHDDF